MKFGLGSFESAFPGRKRPASFDDLYRDVRFEMAQARIVCPFPPGSGFTFRESALIVSDRMPVRWQIQHSFGDWKTTVYDLDQPVAEGWLAQEQAQFQYARQPMSKREEQDFLSTLTPSDTAWKYLYETTDGVVQRAATNLFRGPTNVRLASDADWFAVVIASCIWNDSQPSGEYVFNSDIVPECPTTPGRRILPGGPATQRWDAVKRHYGRRK